MIARLLVFVAVVGLGCGSVGKSGAEGDAGGAGSGGASGVDGAATNPDGLVPDVASQGGQGGSQAADAADGPTQPRDAGPLGSLANPASSCKALLAARPGAASDTYAISATGASDDAFLAYCDMTTAGGGWTKVTMNVPASQVSALRGVSGRQMIKCTQGGSEHIISPPFTSAWTWAGATFVQVPGTWIVNGAQQACGSDPEGTNAACQTWWGVGCGSGPGATNKLFPGVLDQPPPLSCADSTSAHTNSAFAICASGPGPSNYRSYVVFVRAD